MLSRKFKFVLVGLSVLVLAIPAVHWRLVGLVRGEALFDGRPTCYWSLELREFFADCGEPDPASSWVAFLRGPRGRKHWKRSEIVNLWNGGADAIPVIVELLCDEAPQVRETAARSLGGFGKEAAPAIPALERALRDEVRLVRMQAARSLLRVGAYRQPIDPSLLKALKADEAFAAKFVSVLEEKFAPSERDRVAHLYVEKLKNKDVMDRFEAVEYLMELRESAESAVPTLVEALKDESPYVRFAAIRALVVLGDDEPAVTSALLDALQDDDRVVRDEAQRSLKSLGLADAEP